MRDSVRRAFVPFTAPLEGVVRHMYVDVKGLVTVAIGNLIDPAPLALSLPFVRMSDGSPATPSEIVAEWMRIKNQPDGARRGHTHAAKIATLELTPEGVDRVVRRKLDMVDGQLAQRFLGWESWCADAQLATLSMAWACGPGFRFPKLDAALRARDYATAVVECQMREEGNPGLRPRNVANKILYSNAGVVQRDKLDPEELYYPKNLAHPIDREAPTLRELPDSGDDDTDQPVYPPFETVHARMDPPEACPRCARVSCDGSCQTAA